MRYLGLDISTRAGWAVLDVEEGGLPVLVNKGLIQKDRSAVAYGEYPRSYRLAAQAISEPLINVVNDTGPDVVVIEETNKGRNRYNQKLLEWIHLYTQQGWDRGSVGGFEITGVTADEFGQNVHKTLVQPKIVYISTSIWRQALGLKKGVDAKKNDHLLSKAKQIARLVGPDDSPEYKKKLNEEKKRLGIKGKWNKKMLAVNHVNDVFGLSLKLKDNDEAEAICLVLALLANAPICDGDPKGKGK